MTADYSEVRAEAAMLDQGGLIFGGRMLWRSPLLGRWGRCLTDLWWRGSTIGSVGAAVCWLLQEADCKRWRRERCPGTDVCRLWLTGEDSAAAAGDENRLRGEWGVILVIGKLGQPREGERRLAERARRKGKMLGAGAVYWFVFGRGRGEWEGERLCPFTSPGRWRKGKWRLLWLREGHYKI
jgi:hypothetical protein